MPGFVIVHFAARLEAPIAGVDWVYFQPAAADLSES